MAIKKLLEAATDGQSQSELAQRVGVAQTTVSAWKRGASIPPRTRIPALAAALGMPAEELAAMVARERRRRVVGGGTRRSSCPKRSGSAGACAHRAGARVGGAK